MKKRFIILGNLLLVASIGFAQIELNTADNVGIGGIPNTKAKLLLQHQIVATDTVFGLHSTVKHTNNALNKPTYGAYFKNTQTGNNPGSPIYGNYLENVNSSNASPGVHGPVYSVYSKNTGGSVYGFYTDNTSTGYGGTVCGLYVNNNCNNTYNGTAYGAYLKNTKQNNVSGDMHGVRIENVYNSSAGSVYGVHLTVSSTKNTPIYGIHSTVTGINAANTYSGYFTGGKVWIDAELYAWNSSSSVVRITSDERLKRDIKPLSVETNKLYQLQGKSYKKTVVVADLQDSLSIAWRAENQREPVEPIQEFGYLAQELQEIFPELVSKDDVTGYYAVNYIGLIPVIVEALKEQRLANEQKQEQIDTLQKMIQALSVKFEKIEQK